MPLAWRHFDVGFSEKPEISYLSVIILSLGVTSTQHTLSAPLNQPYFPPIFASITFYPLSVPLFLSLSILNFFSTFLSP